MHVVSLAPVPVSSLPWRIGDGPWTLAVLCKLTLLLRPDRAALAKRQEPIHAHDLRTAELPADRILAPADRIPGRPAVDVTVFAPTRDAAGPVGEARLVVGTIDKRVRTVGPLLHELTGHACGSAERPWSVPESYDTLTLPEGSDGALFQCAPRDQRLRELAPDAELRLEGLHPEHRSLVTRLPNVAPQSFVERDGDRRELAMRIDGLWIDARRGLGCLTFRAQLPLLDLDEAGKVFVGVAGPDRRFDAAQLGELVAQLRQGGAQSPPSASHQGRGGDSEGDAHRARRVEATSTSILGALGDDETADSLAGFIDAAPAWLRREGASAGLARPVPMPPPSATPRSAPPSARSADATAAFVAQASETSPPTSSPGSAEGMGPARASVPVLLPQPSLPLPPPTARAPLTTTPGLGPSSGAPSPWSRARPDGEGAHLAASSEEPPREIATEAPRPTETRAPQVGRETIELLWFEENATATLRLRFSARAAELEFEPGDPAHDLATDDPERARAHHIHFGLLTTQSPVSHVELRERMRDAVSLGGRFTPPVLALTGELALPFDPVEHLRATAGAMRPLVGEDRKLLEALAGVDELLASPLAAASTEALQRMLEHVRRSFRDVRRAVTPQELDDVVTRSLLLERRYQRRSLLGGNWIRGLLTPAGARESVPCYLPAPLDAALPLVTSFRVKLLAEAHVRLDQYETARVALRTITLGRVVEL